MARKNIAKDTFKVLREVVEKKNIEKKKFVYSWYIFNNYSLKSKITIDKLDEESEEIHISPLPGTKKELMQMINGFGKINIYLPFHSLLFSSELKEVRDDGSMILTLPETSMFHDRREEERVDLNSVIWVVFEYDGRKFSKKIFDIGLGGMSVVFTKSERFKAQIGLEIKNVVINIGDSKQFIKVDSRITNVLKLRPYLLENCPYGGHRVSFQFLNLSSHQVEFLDKIMLSNLGFAKKS